MTKSVLEVDSIEKQFAHVKAVDHLSFDVREGEVFALLGPNGAGKTTTVRMLMGIIRPDEGVIRYSISNSHSWPLSAELGYLPEERGLYKDTPVLRTLVYLATLRGMRNKQAREAALHWLERLGLKERAADNLDALSKGNQQKTQFISAISPQVWMDGKILGISAVGLALIIVYGTVSLVMSGVVFWLAGYNPIQLFSFVNIPLTLLQLVLEY
jgi:ABC-type uncharacterized transport system ATPase subunit